MKSEHNNRKGGTDTYIVHGVGAIMRAQARPNPLARIFLYHLYLPEGGHGHSLARPLACSLIANGFTKRDVYLWPLR